jgi:hypothetical protein
LEQAAASSDVPLAHRVDLGRSEAAEALEPADVVGAHDFSVAVGSNGFADIRATPIDRPTHDVPSEVGVSRFVPRDAHLSCPGDGIARATCRPCRARCGRAFGETTVEPAFDGEARQGRRRSARGLPVKLG